MQHLCSPHNHGIKFYPIGIKFYSMPIVRGLFLSTEYFFNDDTWSNIIFNYMHPAYLAKAAVKASILTKVDGYPKWTWKIDASWLL